MDHDLPRPALSLVIATQVFLGALFMFNIGALALLPSLSANVAANLPEYADLRIPLLALAIVIIILALFVIAVASLLVRRIHSGTVLARSSLSWVNAIVTSLFCAVTVLIIGFVVISNGQAGNPFLALIQTMACLGLSALAFTTLVLRSLLRHAIFIRTELDDVV